jgi:hypothetical protein
MTVVAVDTRTYTSTYLAGNILRSVTDIVKGCGLDPGSFTHTKTLDLGLRTWLESGHLTTVTLEIFGTRTKELAGRFDFTIDYGYGSGDDGGFWLDTDQVKFAIRKHGLVASGCEYRVLVTTKAGSPDVAGWASTSFLSTDGFTRYSVGTAIGASSTAAGLSYYSRS